MTDLTFSSSSLDKHGHRHARLLMCAPEHFEVTYTINPWMRPDDWQHNPDQLKKIAKQNWQDLYKTFQTLSVPVELVGQQPGLPDMVFTANAAVVLDGKAIVSHFLHKERQGEEKYFSDYFQQLKERGILSRVEKFPAGLVQEGAGDCLWDNHHQIFWAGYGPRSSKEAAKYLQDYFGKEVVALQLASPRFYHIDLSLSSLRSGDILYYPQAFTEAAQKMILERVPTNKLIAISEEDAFNFVCNLVNIDSNIILSRCSEQLKNKLQERGYSTTQTPLDAFALAGGSACCLTLRLDHRSR